MIKNTPYFIHALSPLHPGVGQGVGSVDLPLAREKATGIPYLPGSSVKGVLRDLAQRAWDSAKVTAIFGPDTEHAHEHAGAAYFGDAKLLLLPVRSYKGLFAYATSPFILERFKREAELAGLSGLPNLPSAPGSITEARTTGDALVHDGRVYLEDLDFSAQNDEGLKAWEKWLAERLGEEVPLSGRLLYLHDDAMGFLLETALEVVTRIRIDESTKTVAQGALWFEENIPAESILYGVLAASSPWGASPPDGLTGAVEVLKHIEELAGYTLQFGGKATVGRGLSRMVLVGVNP